MSSKHSSRAWLHAALFASLGFGLAACKGGDGDQAAGPADPAAQSAQAPVAAISAKIAAMTPDQLRDAAAKAVAEQRLYAPAGDNAMEYYLALRDKAPGDVAVSSALTDLQPYTLIATEQGIARDDFAEAKRLYALLEKTDPKAPALPRLKTSIADAEQSYAQRQQDAVVAEEDATKRAELERERLAEQRKMQEEAAKQIQAKQAEDRRIADQQRQQQEQQQAAAREAEERQQRQQAEAARTTQQRPQANAPAASTPAPAPARAAASAGNELREVSIVQPRYPAAALRGGQAGTVQVEFTVGTDGSVTSARVVNADPARIFNNEALSAVKRWRFQPVSSPVTTRRTISFTPQR